MKMLNEVPKVDKWEQTVQVELTLKELALMVTLLGTESTSGAQDKVDRRYKGIKFGCGTTDIPYTLFKDCETVLKAHGIEQGAF